jgi:hypothetical protein
LEAERGRRPVDARWLRCRAVVAARRGLHTRQAPALDLKTLEVLLKDTKAIGFFTKIALKNQSTITCT